MFAVIYAQERIRIDSRFPLTNRIRKEHTLEFRLQLLNIYADSASYGRFLCIVRPLDNRGETTLVL